MVSESPKKVLEALHVYCLLTRTVVSWCFQRVCSCLVVKHPPFCTVFPKCLLSKINRSPFFFCKQVFGQKNASFWRTEFRNETKGFSMEEWDDIFPFFARLVLPVILRRMFPHTNLCCGQDFADSAELCRNSEILGSCAKEICGST